MLRLKGQISCTNGKMALNILVTGKMVKCMERVPTHLELGKEKETDMSGNTVMELEVGKEFILGLTVRGTLVILKTICLKAREPTNS